MVIAIASLIGSRALKRSSQIRCTLLIILSGSVSERRERVTYILEMLKLITVRYNKLNRCRRQETHLKASLLRQSVSFKLSRVCFLKTTFIQCRTWKIWSCLGLLWTIRWLSYSENNLLLTHLQWGKRTDRFSEPSFCEMSGWKMSVMKVTDGARDG